MRKIIIIKVSLWLLLSSCDHLNTDKLDIKSIEVQRVVWGKTDCIDKMLIVPDSIIKLDCSNNVIKYSLKNEKTSEGINFLFSIESFVFEKMTKNIEVKKGYLPTELSYYIILNHNKGNKDTYFISNVFTISDPRSKEEKALYYITNFSEDKS